VERHYSRRPSQFFYGEYEDNDPVSPAIPKYASQFLHTSEDADRRVARLEADFELRKKEEALEWRRRKLEQEERKIEQSSGNSKTANVVDVLGQLTDDEIAAIKAARAGFL
jgi:flagellar motility protein MotE (MotC chaperone)